MEWLFDLIDTINAFVWGPWMMVLVLGTGLWLSIGTGAIQLRKFGTAVRLTVRSAVHKDRDDLGPGEITPFQALMTALSATVGNGNIAGVATAIALGGVGAPVWMWITGLVGMATKYAEAYLGVKYRQTLPNGSLAGGPMYFLEHGLGVKWLAWLFALFGAITALVSGNMVQAKLGGPGPPDPAQRSPVGLRRRPGRPHVLGDHRRGEADQPRGRGSGSDHVHHLPAGRIGPHPDSHRRPPGRLRPDFQ